MPPTWPPKEPRYRYNIVDGQLIAGPEGDLIDYSEHQLIAQELRNKLQQSQDNEARSNTALEAAHAEYRIACNKITELEATITDQDSLLRDMGNDLDMGSELGDA